MINITPRVRFAPSPTGYLHVGGLRTALYNYLYARRNGGTFVLRIEDTDRNRYVEGAVENLIAALRWCGLEFDEGPGTGGHFGPYLQSQRLDLYRAHALELVEKGHAYYCFCTPERLTALRDEQQRQKLPQAKYDKHCLALSPQAIQANIASGMPFVIRLNVPAEGKTIFTDIVRGIVEFDVANIDDQVLLKGDGYPTYHLANVVDDHYMKITTVIRGEEWLPSTPKHILLYDFFGWEKPEFAHLPLLLNPDKSKLSKRQGDVAVEDYRAKGFLKEALVNFVALLGWNAGDDKEYYALDELVQAFSLERVNKSGAVFDIEKLNWLNTEHLRKRDNADLLAMVKQEIATLEHPVPVPDDGYLLQVIEAMKERVSFAREFVTKCPYFYEAPASYEEASKLKNWKPETAAQLRALAGAFNALENPAKEAFEHALKETAAGLGVGVGKLIHPLRLAVSGVSTGPGMYDLLVILGKEESVRRMYMAIEILG